MVMNSWYGVSVKYTKQNEDGTFKRTKEDYLFSANTFTDAEVRVYEELGSIIRGEFAIVGCNPKKIEDIFYDEEGGDIWFNVTVKTQDSNLESTKIKFIKCTYLVNANNVGEALDSLTESLKNTLAEFTIVSISTTSIVDIFPYRENLDVELSREKVEEISEEILDEISNQN